MILALKNDKSFILLSRNLLEFLKGGSALFFTLPSPVVSLYVDHFISCQNELTVETEAGEKQVQGYLDT